jgi:hypothetical protein
LAGLLPAAAEFPDSLPGAPPAPYGSVHPDDQLRLVQATEPSGESPRRRSPPGRGRASRTPYMIGDSPLGPLNSNVSFDGVPLATLEHPIFDGYRFNVAEANAAVPDDRVLLSYRHFHNASTNAVMGSLSTVDVEQFLAGFEKRLADGLLSIDFRVPVYRQLNSDLTILDGAGGAGNLPVADRDAEIGNLATTLKVLLASRDNWAISGGVSVNAPTADDAVITQQYDAVALPIDGGEFASTDPSESAVLIRSRFANEIVNLTPFLAWSTANAAGAFSQGFLQIDVPLNSASASVEASGALEPDATYDTATVAVTDFGQYSQQTLLRLNLSAGYWLYRGSRQGLVRGLAGLCEMHYTASLDNPDRYVANLTTFEPVSVTAPSVPVNLRAGSSVDDFNQVNLAVGCAADLGRTLLTNGVIVPISDSPHRSFDFEYNLQLNRRF